MPKPTILLFSALAVSGMLYAQVPAAPAGTSGQTPGQSAPRSPLPVPGGGEGLDRPAPTQEEALKTAKEKANEIADLQARRIAQQLNLTPAQFAQVRTILMSRQEELRKVMGADSQDPKAQPQTPQERQQRFQQAQQETVSKIAAILTPVQKQQFDAMIERGRAERSRRAASSASRRPVIGAQGSTTTLDSAAPKPDAKSPDAAPAAPAAPAASSAPASPAAPPQ